MLTWWCWILLLQYDSENTLSTLGFPDSESTVLWRRDGCCWGGIIHTPERWFYFECQLATAATFDSEATNFCDSRVLIAGSFPPTVMWSQLVNLKQRVSEISPAAACRPADTLQRRLSFSEPRHIFCIEKNPRHTTTKKCCQIRLFCQVICTES